MKATKSNVIIATLALTLVLILTTSFKQEVKANKYLTIKSLEMYGLYDGGYIWTIDETGKTETIKLEKYKPSNVLPNTMKLTEEINKVASRGYELVSSSSSAADGYSTNTYIFVKK